MLSKTSMKKNSKAKILDNNKKVRHIFRLLNKEYPGAKIALDFKTPVELLVATVLSAQCTDARVNIVTKTLFKKYRTIEAYAAAAAAEFENDIRSTGFYRNKARNIIKSCGLIQDKFGGRVPEKMKDLISLPGVARKTANIVQSNAYGIVEGIAVDTHVRRLSVRLGFSTQNNPDKIEQDLMKLVSRKDWFSVNHLLITHGRNVCKARKPLCPECVIKHLCPSVTEFIKAQESIKRNLGE